MVNSYQEFMRLRVLGLAKLGRKVQPIPKQEVLTPSLTSQIDIVPEYAAREIDEMAAIIAFARERQEENTAC